MDYSIGIDLGGTNIAAAVVDEGYHLLSKVNCKTKLPRSAEEICDDMANLCRQAVEEAGVSIDQIHHVGIGTPGIINPISRMVEFSCNLNFHNVPLAEWMEQRIGKPVTIENDANAAALGELLAGAGKGAESMVAITLGTGIGGGIIINKQIYAGFNFYGGEIGHTVIQQGGRACNCGRHGCFEAYASATGLIKTTEEYMAEHPESLLHQLTEERGKVTARTAFTAMEAGDEGGKQVVDSYIRSLACGLVNVINIFQPEILCLGGGVSNAGETLLKPVQKIIDQEEYARNSQRRTRLIKAQLGNDAGIIGAAMSFFHQKAVV